MRSVRMVSTLAPASIAQLGIVGAGQMGTGIALVAATRAQVERVVVVDASGDAIKKSMAFMDKWFEKEVSKSRMSTEEVGAAKARLVPSISLKELRDCRFVIEAVKEDIEIKRAIIRELGAIIDVESSILATNTSSISITRLAAVAPNPANVIGMHFMNPVPVMKLVEVIRGIATSDETHAVTLDLAKRMGKLTSSSKDMPGFIANRILMPYINEAAFALQDGIATAEDIDNCMKFGTNVPMGPLTLADFIGLDTCLAIMRVLHNELGDSKYRPASLLVQYVDAGWLGKKVGRGFYKYD